MSDAWVCLVHHDVGALAFGDARHAQPLPGPPAGRRARPRGRAARRGPARRPRRRSGRGRACPRRRSRRAPGRPPRAGHEPAGSDGRAARASARRTEGSASSPWAAMASNCPTCSRVAVTGMPAAAMRSIWVGVAPVACSRQSMPGVQQRVERLGRERVGGDPGSDGVRTRDRLGQHVRRPQRRQVAVDTQVAVDPVGDELHPAVASRRFLEDRGWQVGGRRQLAAVVPQVPLGSRQVAGRRGSGGAGRAGCAPMPCRPVSRRPAPAARPSHGPRAPGARPWRRRPARPRRGRCGSARRPGPAAPSPRAPRWARPRGAGTSAGRRRPTPRRPRARRR